MLLYEQHFPASAISAAAAVHPEPVLSQAAHPAPNPFSSHIPAAATAPCFVSDFAAGFALDTAGVHQSAAVLPHHFWQLPPDTASLAVQFFRFVMSVCTKVLTRSSYTKRRKS